MSFETADEPADRGEGYPHYDDEVGDVGYAGIVADETDDADVIDDHPYSKDKHETDSGLPPADVPRAAGDQPPIEPPSDGPAPTAEDPDGRNEAERIDKHFETIAASEARPSEEEVRQLRERREAIQWLGSYSTQSPIAVAFGDEDRGAQHERLLLNDSSLPDLPERIGPERPDEIVERQLGRFSDTITRVREGVAAAADLADLATQHEGRSIVQRHEVREEDCDYIVGRFCFSVTSNGILNIAESRPTTSSDYILRYDTPSGEVHLVNREDQSRTRFRAEGNQLVIVHEDALTVQPGDSQYFSNLREALATYESLLLQVAEHAGFDRNRIIDTRTGQCDRDYLLETVDPVIADPAFEGRIPTELRAALIRGAHGIALRVNASHAGPASITQYRNRLGGYLREALRR